MSQKDTDTTTTTTNACDMPQPSRRPAPIVSLGKIIGYKLACLGFTVRELDTFNFPSLWGVLNNDRKDKRSHRLEKKLNGTNRKRNVTFRDFVEEKTIGEVIASIERHNTNVNALQAKESDTNFETVHKSVRPRRSSNTVQLQLDSPSVKSSLKSKASKGKPKGNLGPKSKTVKTKNKSNTKNGSITSRDQQVVYTTRSVNSLHDIVLEDQPINKTSEASLTLPGKHKEKRLRFRKSELLTRDRNGVSNENSEAKTGKASWKTRNFDATQRKKNKKSEIEKNHQLPSSSSRKVSLSKQSPKSKPNPVPTSNSLTDIECKPTSSVKRWADVVAGSSRNIKNIPQPHCSSTCDNSDILEDRKPKVKSQCKVDQSSDAEHNEPEFTIVRRRKRSRSNSTKSKIVVESSEEPKNNDQDNADSCEKNENNVCQADFPPLQETNSKNHRTENCSEHNNPAFTIAKRRRSRSKSTKNKTVAENSEGPKNNEQDSTDSCEKNENNVCQADLSSLQEANSKNQKKEKWGQRQKEENNDGGNKIAAVKAKTNRKRLCKEARLKKLKIRKRKKRQEKAKKRNILVGNNKETIKSSTHLSTANDQSGNDDKRSLLPQVAHSPSRENTEIDICSKLDAMSVGGGSLESPSCSKSNKQSVSKYSSTKKNRDRSPLMRTRKESKSSKVDEPGPSQKRTSARYRALLRRDRGDSDDEAMENFKSRKWVDSYHRDIIPDPGYMGQRSRPRRSTNPNPNGAVNGQQAQQLLSALNTLCYMVVQNQNGEGNSCTVM